MGLPIPMHTPNTNRHFIHRNVSESSVDAIAPIRRGARISLCVWALIHGLAQTTVSVAVFRQTISVLSAAQ